MERTCIDRGGTFTDVVRFGPDGAVSARKVPSDRAVVGELARGALTFGTTVATNALLTRSGAPTLLIVSRGFADLPWIRDQRRPSLFDADARDPAPLCARVVEVGGRIDARGAEAEPLAIPPLDLTGIASVAVVLINSCRSPDHERAVAAVLADRGVFVSLGCEQDPELGYLARIETTLVDAAITPILRASMDRDRVPSGALAMRSDGGLCPAPTLRAPDAVLSGPAGGVLAVAAVAAMAGFEAAVGLDMGGTSTDVCRVERGALPRREGANQVAGVWLRRPTLEVETIAAGGGSILRSDGIRLQVGPESAGADPGPACYGRGGPPTVTDAALRAGLLDPDAFDPPLDDALAEIPGDPLEFLDVAREAMAQAVRRIATARGVDLRGHALVAYGGAAGQHAAEVAARLGVDVVLMHPCAAALSAWGQSLARQEAAAVEAIWAPLEVAWPRVEAAWGRLLDGLPSLGPVGEGAAEIERSADLRYAGTEHPVEIFAGSAAEAAAAFRAAHRRRYGFDRPDHAIEVVNARVRARAPAPSPPAGGDDPWGLGDRVVAGPARIDCSTTSAWVPPGWRARRDRGLLWIERGSAPSALAAASTDGPPRRTPYGVELWGARFMAVAEQAGEVLRRLARSVNIRERLDFSCAVFDGGGRLVANAPHIPVHLGAMGETVRDLLRRVPEPPPGQCWLSNDPAAGGSHLPDLTVVTAVRAGAERWFVACRGHHVDVGGLTPGSMPPRSTRLDQEGVVLRQVPLLVPGGSLRDLRPLLSGCRDPDTVIADIEAQIAANRHAADALAALGPPRAITAWMAHLRDAASQAADAVIGALAPGAAQDDLDGIPLQLRLVPGDGALAVDLSGTGGPHPGNLNAPPAVVRAAALYAIRCLVGREIPLNDGVMRRVRIDAPAPSIVAPPPGAAVVGGNVETSQRLVDLFLAAAGARAASQGTMNNLTLGGRRADGSSWSLYETVGGGCGAGPRGPGASGRQVHMTNTRSTDPEVIEARLPLRVHAFALRTGSGGAGAHPGGDGLIREIELLAPGDASLLVARRAGGATGLAGGGAGAPGRYRVRRGGVWSDWDGETVALQPGDRVRVETPGGGGWGAE